jgi:predicted amidohydrolase YtcJ
VTAGSPPIGRPTLFRPSTLFRRVRLAPAEPPGERRLGRGHHAEGLAAVLVTGDQVAWAGPDDRAPDPGPGARQLDAGGHVMLPAFTDAHVHVTETGLWLDGADLSLARSAQNLLDLVAQAVRERPGQPVIGHGWDELRLADHRLPTLAELDRAAAGADVYLSRIDVHSALVSSALAARAGLATLDGWDPSGRVERDAHHAARHSTRFGLTADRRRAVQRRALAGAAAAGIAQVHECSAPHIAPEQDLRDLLELSAVEPLPQVVPYWGELAGSASEATQIRDRVLGPAAGQLAGLAGDLMADGSIGSRSAALAGEYTDQPGHRGHLYLTAEQIGAHVSACTRTGLQAGFHAIGDRAVSTVLAGFHLAAADLGPDGAARLRAARHRIEHLEGLDGDGVAVLRQYGVIASVQPTFDAEWGGQHGMYTHRLGAARALALNPFATLHAGGVELAFGSDSPVTPFGPWTAIRAALRHHNDQQRLPPRTALGAHVTGPLRIRAGMRADLAIWAMTDLDQTLHALATQPGVSGPACLATIGSGRILSSSGLTT